jgi:hypothetical protein
MGNNRSDPRFRSLLHKAVRRGSIDLVFTTCALLEDLGPKEKARFTQQVAIITFEECWPLGTELVFNRRFHSKAAALVKVAQSVKAKDAAGLGSLGYALSKGDQTVLSGAADDKDIRIVAGALERPKDFWAWIESQTKSDFRKKFIENAARFKNAGFPWQRAFIAAGAFLGVTAGFPELKHPIVGDTLFPYWIALDQQTPQGRRALRDIARDLHIQMPQLIWASFYYEGSRTNRSLPSKWWQRSCDWRFRKVGMLAEEAHLLWEPAKIQVMEALAEDSRQLHNDLYAWKIANRERVELLKKQVELFMGRSDGRTDGQLDLF